MNNNRRYRYILNLFLVLFVFGSAQLWGQWSQWGGPERNFQIQSEKLNLDWPEEAQNKFGAGIWTMAILLFLLKTEGCTPCSAPATTKWL